MLKIGRLHVPASVLLLGLSDTAVLYFSISLGMVGSYAGSTALFVVAGDLMYQKTAFAGSILLSLFIMGLYQRQFLVNVKLTVIRLAAACLVATVVMFALFYVLPETRIWRSALLPALSIGIAGLLAGRLVFTKVTDIGVFRRRVVVLGTEAQARQIELLERSENASRFRCVGFIASGSCDILVESDRVVRSQKALPELVALLGAQEVVVALQERRSMTQMDALLTCRLRGVQVSHFSSFMEREKGQVELEALYPSWLIFSDGFSSQHRGHRLIKRAFDIVVSLIFLVITLPVTLVTALAIWLQDRGPVFYRQARVGLHDSEFRLLKFRSMRVDAEKDGVARWAEVDDPRVTRVGALIRRTRIDEFPQVINVLRGEMSFIGPRPERPSIVADLSREIRYYAYRHTVKPGITGWAQINYPYGASLEDARQKLKYDLYYIKNYSLVLDLLILLQTLRVVLWPQGVR